MGNGAARARARSRGVGSSRHGSKQKAQSSQRGLGEVDWGQRYPCCRIPLTRRGLTESRDSKQHQSPNGPILGPIRTSGHTQPSAPLANLSHLRPLPTRSLQPSSTPASSSTRTHRNHGDRVDRPVRARLPEAASRLPELEDQVEEQQGRPDPPLVQGCRSGFPYPQDRH